MTIVTDGYGLIIVRRIAKRTCDIYFLLKI